MSQTNTADPRSIRRPDFLLAGQPYWRQLQVEYVRKDGSATRLDAWISLCAECGEQFETLLAIGGVTAERGPQQRRCKVHSKPGKRISQTGIFL